VVRSHVEEPNTSKAPTEKIGAFAFGGLG